MRQRLAAVMAADIVDYTRLMGADQAGTLQALQAFRTEVLRPSVSKHSGVLIKDMGDGWLAEFASASEAVSCALAVQDALDRQNTLRLRIGINIGDVLHEAEDIFGDGVNVAARLQTIAPPGGIALSGAVHSVLDGTLSPAFSDAGLHELKNVTRPIQVWMRAPTSGDPASDADAVSAALKLTRLAIRPLVASGQDRALDDLALSIGSAIRRYLDSSDWIAPRLTPLDANTDYALSGLLRARGDQLRLEVELLGATRDTVWTGAFDGTMSGSFDWQDQVGLEVAADVFGAITDRERDRLFDKPVGELSAPECLECAMLEFFEISNDALANALSYVDRAIHQDPGHAPAYLQGLRCVTAAVVVGCRNGVRDWLPKVPQWLESGETDLGNPMRFLLYRAIWTYMETRDAAALKSGIDEVLAEAPSDLDILALGGWAYVWLGEPDRAIACFRKFEERGHFSSMTMAMRAGLATALVQSGREADAAEQAGAILRRTRDFAAPSRALASANAHLGDMPQARDAVAEALRLVPGDTIAALKARSGFADAPANQHYFEGLRKAGYPEN
ncbi:MAG: adenylate/guanylate cyclase domain-containing protein [Pseudomonadota bacterium]